jgi:putative flippase GtrA
MSQDFKNALIIGAIIGIFAIPTELKLGIAAKSHYIYIFTLIVFPLLALVGLWFTKVLFSKIPVLWQFSKFGLVGVANTAINFGILNLFAALTGINKGWPIYFFASLAFLGALMNSYIWNSHWSFENKNPRSREEFIEFFLITFIGLQISSLIVTLVSTKIHPAFGLNQDRWLNVANLIATLLVMFWNFSGFKFIVFRPKKAAA